MKNIPQKVHFVGIGGIGVSALAQHLARLGHTVSGSDRAENAQTAKLRNCGVSVFVPHSAENVRDAQLVVRTSAVPTANCEVQSALQRNIPVVLREELLGQIFDGYPVRVAVCGTHGKTTVTAMLHHVLERCGVGHTAFIGGEYDGANYFFGENIVVAEACEYNRSFLHLHPTLCLCLNAEFDHPDCYRNLKEVEQAFERLFLQSGKTVLARAQHHLCRNAVVYDEEFCAKNVRFEGGHALFDLFCDSTKICPVRLGICGEHNISNALAVLAVARELHLPLLTAAQALATFRGVDRRFTATKRGALNIVCDYAHHPTEIAATVQTARQTFGGRIVAVFQPHTYSRTQAFFREFVTCFDGADEILYLPVYSAREKPLPHVSSFRLFREAKGAGKNTKYFANFARCASYLKRTATGATVLLVGAGNVNELADLL